jgi:hypothetical protein
VSGVNYLEKEADVSPCGLYRYTLTRHWNPDRETVAFCLLNPSTADGERDDPTIRRCVGFADAWGYGRLVVVNLFALRATEPAELRKAADPVGPDNDRHIVEATAGRVTICAWGATVATWPSHRLRTRVAIARRVLQWALVRHLGLTKDGHPKHPLYLPADVIPLTFPEAK